MKVTFGPNIPYGHHFSGSTITFVSASSLGSYMTLMMSEKEHIPTTDELWLKNAEEWYIIGYITILGQSDHIMDPTVEFVSKNGPSMIYNSIYYHIRLV